MTINLPFLWFFCENFQPFLKKIFFPKFSFLEKIWQLYGYFGKLSVLSFLLLFNLSFHSQIERISYRRVNYMCLHWLTCSRNSQLLTTRGTGPEPNFLWIFTFSPGLASFEKNCLYLIELILSFLGHLGDFFGEFDFLTDFHLFLKTSIFIKILILGCHLNLRNYFCDACCHSARLTSTVCSYFFISNTHGVKNENPATI